MADKKQTRADKTRQRRVKQQKKGEGKVARTKSRKPGTPPTRVYQAPTMIRGLNSDLPLRKKEITQPRRRYNISLGSPGAEIKLPYVPNFQPSWQILSWVLLLALLAGLFYLWNMPTFQVNAPFLEGATHVTARDANLVLGLNQTPVFTLSPSEIRRDLMMAFPVFASVEVEIKWPNLVNITVEERAPAIVWQHANGVLWVDANGVAFPAPKEIDSLPVILATEMILTPSTTADGSITQLNTQQAYQLLNTDLVTALLLLKANAPEGMPIFFDLNHGYGWQAEQGWQVFFGEDLSNLDEKLIVYQGILSHLESEKINPKIVSVEYVNAPYYRLDR